MIDAKEKTALATSVGADERQSIQLCNTSIITTENTEINYPDENSSEKLEEIYRQMQRMNDPAYLHTVSMNDLYETVFQSRPPVIDGLLYSGTYLFAGAPKVGKSFFMAQLAYHISTGQKLWDYDVHQGTVLYLALEDDYQRLQERMSRMFGVEGTDSLHFAVYAKQLGAGLDEQLENYIILDVRTPEEFSEKHIPGAINIPNETIGTEEVPELPDKDQLILIYCRSGNRSKQASEKLVRLGYMNIVEFGGINDWPGNTVNG